MESELDVNAVAAEFLQQNVDKIIAFAGDRTKAVSNRLRVGMTRTFSDYVTRILARYSTAKSFFVRMEPLPLYQIFVPLDLATDKRRLSRPEFADVIRCARHTFITGSGGSGKSMVMRHLLISCLRAGKHTPVFLELRDINAGDISIREAILMVFTRFGLTVDGDFLERALTAGHLCLFLDGVDELSISRRRSVATEVKELADKYPSTPIIASSRPDSELHAWTAFTQLALQPLDLDRAAQLVQKVHFDDPLKEKFLTDLRAGLFENHRSFLSNPLLLSIMLITYSDVAHIPGKLSIFYNQAYEALFLKHDALKGGFQRERYSKLDIQDFANTFAAFCIQSYDRREFSFSKSRALDLFDRARTISQIGFSSEAMLNDSIQAVCLLVEEGLDVGFAHRSFQEFFAARFITSSPPEAKRAFVEKYAPTIEADSVLQLLHEMDPYAVEQYFLLPTIERVKQTIGIRRRVGVTHHLRFLKLVYNAFQFNTGLSARIRDVPACLAFSFIESHYLPEWNRYDSSNLGQLLLQEVGGSEIPTSALKTSSPFYRELSANSYWSLAQLQGVFDAADQIRAKQESSAASVEDILSTAFRGRAPRAEGTD